MLNLSGVTTYAGEKHIVGNGIDKTTLTGDITCTSKTTVSNLSLQDVGVTGGTLTVAATIPDGSTVTAKTGGTILLDGAYIASGGSVAVSGGSVAIEKVTGSGEGSVIDLGGTTIDLRGSSGYMSGVMLSGNNATGLPLVSAAKSGGIIGSCTMVDVVVSGVTTTNDTGSWRQGGLVNVMYGGNATLSSCSFIDNNPYSSVAINFGYAAVDNKISLVDCTFGEGEDIALTCHSSYAGGAVHIAGSNSLKNRFFNIGSVNYNGITISSGAVIDLTGNTNSVPINPGGSITFETGGATVLYSSGAVSGSYMMDNVKLPAGTMLTDTNEVKLGGVTVGVSGAVSGIAFSSGRFNIFSGASASDVTGNVGANISVSSGGIVRNATVNSGGYVNVFANGSASNTTVNPGGYFVVWAAKANGTTVNSKGAAYVNSGGSMSEPVISSGGSLIVSSGGSALLVTSNSGANVTVLDDGYITYKE